MLTEVRVVFDGVEKAVEVPADGELELDKIGQELFSLYPSTVSSIIGDRPRVRDVTGAPGPLELVGLKGPLEPGYEAKLLVGQDVYDRVRLRARLQWEFLPRDVLAYRIALENEEPFALKLFYNNRDMHLPYGWGSTSEIAVLRSIEKLRAEQGLECHSLPVMVEYGYLYTGECSHSIVAVVMTPCVPSMPPGKAFSGRQLCTAAFDILLAVYHLRALNWNVSWVLKSDILFVEQDEVFVFANLSRTELHEAQEWEEDLPARGLLMPASLVLTLAALSGMEIVAGWDKNGSPDVVEVAAAVARLRQQHPLLGDLADAFLVQLQPIYGRLDYEEWLHALVEVSDRSSGMIRKQGLLETAMQRLSGLVYCAS